MILGFLQPFLDSNSSRINDLKSKLGSHFSITWYAIVLSVSQFFSGATTFLLYLYLYLYSFSYCFLFVCVCVCVCVFVGKLFCCVCVKKKKKKLRFCAIFFLCVFNIPRGSLSIKSSIIFFQHTIRMCFSSAMIF